MTSEWVNKEDEVTGHSLCNPALMGGGGNQVTFLPLLETLRIDSDTRVSLLHPTNNKKDYWCHVVSFSVCLVRLSAHRAITYFYDVIDSAIVGENSPKFLRTFHCFVQLKHVVLVFVVADICHLLQ